MVACFGLALAGKLPWVRLRGNGRPFRAKPTEAPFREGGPGVSRSSLESAGGPDDEGKVVLVEDDPECPVERVGPSVLGVIRGIGGIATVWAGAWGALGLAIALGLSVAYGFPMLAVVPTILNWGVAGFLTGAGFAALLTTMERKHLLEELSIPRMGLWGALGGFTVSLLVFLVMGLLPLVGLPMGLIVGAKAGVLGGLSAMGTTVLAKSSKDGSDHSERGGS